MSNKTWACSKTMLEALEKMRFLAKSIFESESQPKLKKRYTSLLDFIFQLEVTPSLLLYVILKSVNACERGEWEVLALQLLLIMVLQQSASKMRHPLSKGGTSLTDRKTTFSQQRAYALRNKRIRTTFVILRPHGRWSTNLNILLETE